MKVAFFDVDGVIVKGQTQKFLIKYLLKKRKIPLWLYIKIYFWFIFYKLGLVKETIKIREKVIKYFKGQDVVEFEKIFDDFFEKEIKQRINKKVFNLIKKHLENKDIVVLTSASLEEIVERIKNYVGANFVIATKLGRNSGKYTGEIDGKIPYGENKVLKIKEFLEEKKYTFEESYAYSDHISDLPLLEFVENPCAVNPDKELRKVAIKKGWKIYDLG
jgi:HAD superfamily hydrolase (TIGR01490 family)